MSVATLAYAPEQTESTSEAAVAPRDAPVRRLEPDSLGDHATRLYRAAYGLCGSREDAEDLVQDTYERILRRPRFLRHEHDLAYLLRVMRNTWISKARGRRVAVIPIDAEEAEAIPDEAADAAGRWVEANAIYEALGKLTEPLREAVVAVDVVGLSYREAARALGTKEGTIMSRLHRARGQLATRLSPVA